MTGIVYPPKTAATGLPAGKAWPGEFVTDGFRLRHINGGAAGVDNVAAWQALGSKGPEPITGRVRLRSAAPEMAWGFVIGIVTLPYQWAVMLRDWWRNRKNGSDERPQPKR